MNMGMRLRGSLAVSGGELGMDPKVLVNGMMTIFPMGVWGRGLAVILEPNPVVSVVYTHGLPPRVTVKSWGSLDAESVANSSRTAFCVKVQNPNRPCTISLPAEIDHGVVLPTETNIAKITGSVSCGDSPYVQFLGGDHLSLSSQVHTYLEAEVIDHTRLMITSTLNSSSAEPGQYHASAVVIVSPE